MRFFGITGKNCAGKDEVADLIEAAGFERYSLSDALRAELDARGLERSRKICEKLGLSYERSMGRASSATR
jgi:dephospho-CoA kinase